jgi:ABC-2 type transport system ATP-binding protein
VAVAEVEGLTKRYGDVVAVDHLSFAVEAGEVFALLGPNGAGKTTTVEIFEGLRSKDAGEVHVLGFDPARDIRRIASRIGVMPQSADLQQGLRAGEAVRLFASFYDRAEDPGAIMSRLQIDRVARTPYRRLSGGEKRRLSLALAIVGRPDVAFLDEPTAGMDVEGRRTTWDVIRELRDGGAAVILTTHLLDEAERVADRVAIVHGGRLAALGPPSELAGDRREITFAVDGSIDSTALAAALGAAVEQTSDGYRITGVEPDGALIARLTAWLAGTNVTLRRLVVGARTLEDAYLDITAGR